ncbi:MAG: hypothetical protein ACXWWQ_02245 [Candidatus Limnocylindria bacterium]
MHRQLRVLFAGLAAVSMLSAASLFITAPASAVVISPTVTCNNALGNGGAVCETTVVNTITPSGASAVVTVRECIGSAGVPDAACTTTTQSLSEAVTAVNQCDGSINGGGGTLLCSVTVTNNFIGITPAPTVTAATVDQCNGSLTTGTVRACSPDPASTTGATITQCNNSANGGGASLTCTASGTQSSGLAFVIDQCNGSSNGGGTRTVCSATITNNVLPVGATPPGAASPAPALPVLTPNTSAADAVAGSSQNPLVIYTGLVILSALSLTLALRFRRD